MNKQQLLSHSAASKAVTGQKAKMVLIISRESREHQDTQVLCHRLGSHNSHWQLEFPILAFLPWHTGKTDLLSLWAQGCFSQRWGKQQKPSCFLRSEPGSVWQPRESASQPHTTHVMSKYSLTETSSAAICYLIRLATTSLSQSSPSALSLPKETVTSKTPHSESQTWFLWSQAPQCPHCKVTTSCSYLGNSWKRSKAKSQPDKSSGDQYQDLRARLQEHRWALWPSSARALLPHWREAASLSQGCNSDKQLPPSLWRKPDRFEVLFHPKLKCPHNHTLMRTEQVLI